MSNVSPRLPRQPAVRALRRREAAFGALALSVVVIAWLTTSFPALGAARETLLSIVAFLFLVFPGFVIAQLLRNEGERPDAVSLLSAATIALGLVGLGGLLLDLLPFGGITGTTWLVLVGALMAIAAALRFGVARARAGARQRSGGIPATTARQASRLIPIALLVASAVALSLVALGNSQPTPGALAIWFCAVCPGIAIQRLIGMPSGPADLTLAFGISVGVSVAVGGLLLVLGVFAVASLLQVVVGLTVAALIADPWLYARQWEPAVDRMEKGSVIVLVASLVGVLVGHADPLLLPVLSVGVLGLGVAAMVRWLESASGGSVTLAMTLGAAAMPGLLVGYGFENVGEIAVVVSGYGFIVVAAIRYFRGGGLGIQLWLGLLTLLAATLSIVLGGLGRIPPVAAAALPVLVGLGLAAFPMIDRPSDTERSTINGRN